MFVKNVLGSSDDERKCKCKSWIAHWERNRGGTVNTECMAIGCREKDKKEPGGGHVTIRGELTEYIVPLCTTHNAIPAGQEFEVSRAASPVPAHKCRA